MQLATRQRMELHRRHYGTTIFAERRRRRIIYRQKRVDQMRIIVRPNYRITLGMLVVFLCLTTIAVIFGDSLGIGVCAAGASLLLAILTYQVKRIYFTITENTIEFSHTTVIKRLDIAEFEVYESRGKLEGYYNCLNLKLNLKVPASKNVIDQLRNQKWATLSQDARTIAITLNEPSVHTEEIRKALVGFAI